MARKATWPPKVSRHSSGQARCCWRGKDYYLGPWQSEEAQRNYARLLVELGGADGSPPPSGEREKVLTVAGAVTRYESEVLPTHTAEGRELEQFRLSARPLLRLFASQPAALTAQQFQQLQQTMAHGTWMTDAEKAEARRRQQPIGWCSSTVNRRCRRVKTLVRWLELCGAVPPGSYLALKVVPRLRLRDRTVRHAPRRQPSTRADIDAVLPHVQPRFRRRPVAAMLEVQWWAGMRSCEVRLMRPCDIDRAGPVAADVQAWVYRPPAHKTAYLGHSRAIVLGPRCQELLAPWLLGCPPTGYVFSPALDRSRPYKRGSYADSVRRACARAGVKLVAYGGRHATKDRVAGEFGLEAARAVLGHSTLAQTHEYGSQLDLQKAAEVAARIG